MRTISEQYTHSCLVIALGGPLKKILMLARAVSVCVDHIDSFNVYLCSFENIIDFCSLVRGAIDAAHATNAEKLCCVCVYCVCLGDLWNFIWLVLLSPT